MVFRGRKQKTTGGLKQDGLMRNKRGKIVSKKQAAQGLRRYVNIEGWTDSLMEARKALHITGFVAVNGKSLQGKALYVKSKALWTAHGGSSTKTVASNLVTASAVAVAGA